MAEYNGQIRKLEDLKSNLADDSKKGGYAKYLLASISKCDLMIKRQYDQLFLKGIMYLILF
ncbi:MAG TPA: hypothetical protein DEP00_04015 [Lachnospiraceae bacterium]|nr:hypothetical protein [Lachnospiraceae bacterium]